MWAFVWRVVGSCLKSTPVLAKCGSSETTFCLFHEFNLTQILFDPQRNMRVYFVQLSFKHFLFNHTYLFSCQIYLEPSIKCTMQFLNVQVWFSFFYSDYCKSKKESNFPVCLNSYFSSFLLVILLPLSLSCFKITLCLGLFVSQIREKLLS